MTIFIDKKDAENELRELVDAAHESDSYQGCEDKMNCMLHLQCLYEHESRYEFFIVEDQDKIYKLMIMD